MYEFGGEHFHKTRMMSETTGFKAKTTPGPIDPRRSGIVQAYEMGQDFDQYKDALITPVIHENDSLVLLPPQFSFLEPLTKAPWWLHLVTWIPFVAWQWFGKMSCPCSFSLVCIFAVSFAMVWPLLEYVMHRFLFHMPVAWAKGNPWINVIRFLMHTVHHAHPRDRMRLITPLPMSLAIAAIVFPIPLMLLRNMDDVRACVCGLIMGFVVYDYVHYFLHFGKPDTLPEPLRGWSRVLQKAHVNHHYAPRGMTQSFGVSHTVWDEWFGTFVTPQHISGNGVEKDAPKNTENKMDKVD